MRVWSKRWSFPKWNPFEKKASMTSAMIADLSLGKPLWTPRRYDKLAEEGYQKNIIVYRCVSLIARGVASADWKLYNGKNNIDFHPLLRILNAPNPRQGRVGFIEMWAAYLLLSGNAYVEAVIPPHAHEPYELYLLRPDRVQIVPGKKGVAEAYEYKVNGKTLRIPVNSLNGLSRVLHVRTFHPLNDWYGMSPVEAAAHAIDQHNAVAGHNLALLQNGGRPTGALLYRPKECDHLLTEEQRTRLRQDLSDVYEGARNAGKVMVLEGDFEWKEMGLSPKDLDFIQGKYLSAREIAQAYGVPPMLVGIPGESTFSNYKEARFHLWEDTILPLLDLLKSELNRWLVPQFGGGNLFLSYDVDSLSALAPKREATWDRISKATFLTMDEKREALGYPPLSKSGNDDGKKPLNDCV